MAMEAAKVLEKLGVPHVVLHGGLPGKDRKAVLERFQNDPECKVFISTDAGGTGLNLQTADTVMNLELPWNPAVLEQRIARVHRMGQSRPVRVINFVTLNTIEERVLRTLEAKQTLFAGLFAGDADEIPFEAINTGGFLDTMRELVGLESPTRKPATQAQPNTNTATEQPLTLWHGIAQIVEGACAVLNDANATRDIPPEVRTRLQTAVHSLADKLRPASE
jgi:superfamily II DNA/RNA helicase